MTPPRWSISNGGGRPITADCSFDIPFGSSLRSASVRPHSQGRALTSTAGRIEVPAKRLPSCAADTG